VAYWNLPQRRLEQAGQGWTVDGAPLTFFHFSGFDPRKPTRLSKHDSRFATDMPEPLRRLTAHYGERLLERGYGKIPGYLYAYGRFASGTAIHHIVRKMFRESHKYWAGDPFDTYEAFLHEPWPGASRAVLNHTVTNFIKFIHGSDPRLSGRLDLRQPGHVAELVHWFVNDAVTELHLDLPLVEPVARRVGTLRRPPLGTVPPRRKAPDKDVTVVGYLRTASGVGEVGRQTLRTLAASGWRAEGLDVGLSVAAARDDASCEALLAEAATAPVQIFNIIADQLPSVLQHLEPHLRADALRISMPFWELAQFPVAWLGSFGTFHEVWAPTRFIQAALAGRTDRPVVHMPVAFELDPITAVPRNRFGLPENRYLFFFAFDFLSFMERNSPRVAIRAFCEAFRQRGQACLVLRCLNGVLAPDARSTLLAEIDGNPDIVLLDQTLSREDALGLIAACDAVLFLHRSEGLGLLIAEAMLLDKPVIATGYSASRELVTEQTGYPVDFHLVPVGEGEYPFHSGQLWAEVDVVHAAWIMRRLQRDPQQAGPLVARARDLLRDKHSRIHVAALQTRRLGELGMQRA
jgi:glycosyltransferase involved in cell wall biosynthesis